MAVLTAACGFSLLAISGSRSGEAAFPGANGRIAYGYGEAYSRAIWAANPDGTTPTMLTLGAGDENPTYSADGNRIAFERNNGIAVMNADGSGVVQLVSGVSTTSSETKWVEDYETDEGPPRTIPVVRIQTVKGSRHSFASPSFSPDGSQLAVSEEKEATKLVTTCAVEAIEDEKCLEYGAPDAYFDFDFEFECPACASRIVTISSASGARTGTVTSPPSGAHDVSPAYSVDGKIAFSRWAGSNSGSGIYVVSSPGAAPNQVTFGGNAYSPDFSPDGSKIAFGRSYEELGIVGAGGGLVTALPVPSPPGSLGAATGAPSFSPDGTKLIFDRTVFFGGRWDYGVFTIGTNGAGLTKVLNKGFEPTWQPAALTPPPAKAAKAKARKGRVRLNRKGKARIATITCGSSPCRLKVLFAKLKAGKKKCFVKSKLAKRLAPGKSAPLSVKVSGKCLAALKKAGKGKLVTKVQVVDALGKQVLTLRSTLVPAKPKPRKRKKGSA